MYLPVWRLGVGRFASRLTAMQKSEPRLRPARSGHKRSFRGAEFLHAKSLRAGLGEQVAAKTSKKGDMRKRTSLCTLARIHGGQGDCIKFCCSYMAMILGL